ncbi:TIGR04255 family protein [Nocardia sp. NPDC059240]|uniref:TIGR04255 family protein n=1 Tax=Nocardia sp. NPDC059240 TaxID=3346786 RepID=UPI003689F71D
MASVVLGSPFSTEPLVEVPLANPPLAQVLAQVRFAKVSQLWVGDAAARQVVASMTHEYPIFDQKQETGFHIGPDGIQPVPANAQIWQLQSQDRQWMITFGDSFFALTAWTYTSRTEFASRLQTAWQHFCNVIESVRHERVGVRYINRIAEPDVDGLAKLVRPEMLGELATPLGAGVRRQHSISEATYAVDEREGLHVRWGLLPAGAAFDPTVPTVDSPSWVLDMDAYLAYPDNAPVLRPDDLAQTVKDLAERAYRYFRWSVTDDYLTAFGESINVHY